MPSHSTGKTKTRSSPSRKRKKEGGGKKGAGAKGKDSDANDNNKDKKQRPDKESSKQLSLPSVEELEEKTRKELEDGGTMDTEKVMDFVVTEQLKMAELCDCFDDDTASKLSKQMGISWGDGVGPFRLSKQQCDSERKKKRARMGKIEPAAFRTGHSHWFSKGFKKQNTPERRWLKSKMSSELLQQKVSENTTCCALMTDTESKIKEEMIRAQLDIVNGKKMRLKGLPEDIAKVSDVMHETAFTKFLPSEIAATMTDRCKNHKRKQKKAADAAAAANASNASRNEENEEDPDED
eukprot:jgi/Bigna1/147336/aug1.141_g22044